MINLKVIPQQPQRQDSVTDQLRDLQHVANRLGMYDAADAIKGLLVGTQVKTAKIKCGCHIELDEGMVPDDCVINMRMRHLCSKALYIGKPEDCEHWHPIDFIKYPQLKKD